MRYLCAGTHPDHDTICAFRRNNLKAVATAFVEVLELARELKQQTIQIEGPMIHGTGGVGFQSECNA